MELDNIHPFASSFKFYTIIWDDLLYVLRGHRLSFQKNIVCISMNIDFVSANSLSPDEISHFEAFYPGLHCLPKYPFSSLGVSLLQTVKGLANVFQTQRFFRGHTRITKPILKLTSYTQKEKYIRFNLVKQHTG